MREKWGEMFLGTEIERRVAGHQNVAWEGTCQQSGKREGKRNFSSSFIECATHHPATDSGEDGGGEDATRRLTAEVGF